MAIRRRFSTCQTPTQVWQNFASRPQIRGVNPLCGDRIRVELRLAGNGAVEEISFSGEMCAIAKASASILLPPSKGQHPRRSTI
jgi:NifU-like protein involved in Fe-S cluster formation